MSEKAKKSKYVLSPPLTTVHCAFGPQVKLQKAIRSLEPFENDLVLPLAFKKVFENGFKKGQFLKNKALKIQKIIIASKVA